jgi:hypothetical protein
MVGWSWNEAERVVLYTCAFVSSCDHPIAGAQAPPSVKELSPLLDISALSYWPFREAHG